MNKADEKQLKKDPRYQRIAAAYASLQSRLRAAEEAHAAEVKAAEVAYREAAPEMAQTKPAGSLDEQILHALRPRGDTVRVAELGWLGRNRGESDCEVENVTATQVSLVGHSKPFRDGYARHSDSLRYRIHEDDLERIKAGEIKGWRQKPWGMP